MFSWYVVLWSVPALLLAYVIRQLLSKEGNEVKLQWKIYMFYFLTSCIMGLCIPFYLIRPRNVMNALYTTYILKHITLLMGVTWELRNEHILSEDRGFVIVANHQFSLDPLGVFNVWYALKRCCATTRIELFYAWPFGLAAYLVGSLFIDRNNPKKAYSQLNAATDVMVKGKTKIFMFPEGTRNLHTKGMLPFRRGAFKMAVTAQVPVVPVVFSPYYFVNVKKQLFSSGRVIVTPLDPIETKGLTDDDIPELIERTRALMLKKFYEVSEEVLSALPPDYPLSEHYKI